MKESWVYILTNWTQSVLYIGMTGDLNTRVLQHQQGLGSDFAATYCCRYCVHLESFHDIQQAIRRETQLKNWKRAWKDELIAKDNPEWRDLVTNVLIGIGEEP